MLYGWARVSSDGQDVAMQVAALKRAGVRHVVQDTRSGAAYQPLLVALIESMRPGDVLVVWKVDRLARTLRGLLDVADALRSRDLALRSLTEPIDTSTPIGEAFFQLLGVFSQLERSMIRERCATGVREYLAAGHKWGRPRRLDWAEVARLDKAGLNPCQIGRQLGAHHSGVRYVLRSLKARKKAP